MSQQRFSDIERRALWEAHRKRCLYCRQPLLFKELLIDHVVPETFLKTPERLAEIKVLYGLGETFDIRGDGNLAPACYSCNLDKHDRLLATEQLAIVFARVRERIAEFQRLRQKYERSAGIDDAILGLICSLQSGSVTTQHIEEVLRRLDEEDANVTLYRSIEFLDGVVVSEISRSNVEDPLDRPVKLGTDLPEGLELVRANGSTVAVRTTRDYRTAVQQGYYAPTTFAMKMEAFFKLPLALLTAMERARQAEHSFIR